jgi:integrase
MRRGELCALRWQDVDLDSATLKVERSLEQTRKGGLRFKAPKSARGRRTISLSPAIVSVLRTHWKAQQEQRLSLGLGKSPTEGLVFANWDGTDIAKWVDQGICRGDGKRRLATCYIAHAEAHARLTVDNFGDGYFDRQ